MATPILARTRPTVVEAMRIDRDNLDSVRAWLATRTRCVTSTGQAGGGICGALYIRTPHGELHAGHGAYVVLSPGARVDVYTREAWEAAFEALAR